jgi:agmatine deiminase
MAKNFTSANTRWNALLVALSVGACAEPGEVEVAGAAALPLAEAASGCRAYPAEFEPQDAIWMAWPTYENVAGRPTEEVHRQIIAALAPYERVNLLAQDQAEIGAIKADLEAHGVPFSHVRFHAIEHTDIWMRDMGPFFLGRGPSKAVVDWKFNGWGYAEFSDVMAASVPIDDVVDAAVARRRRLPLVRSTMTMEGGTLESNGRGTLMTSEAVVFQRNPQYGGSRAPAEAEFKRVLGVKKVVWLPKGVVDDESTFLGPLPLLADSTDHPTGKPRRPYTVITTGGHVDEYARFVGPRTVLLAEVTEDEARRDPVAAINKPRLDANYAVLRAETDQDGRPFEIVRIPTPDPVYFEQRPGDGVYDFLETLRYTDGSTFPSGEPILTIEANGYANFIIANKVVLAPKFWKPGRPQAMRDKDEHAAAVLRSVFPTRKVVQIDAENVNLGGGGLHCIVIHEPR